MGFPLSPFHKKTWLDNCPEQFKPIYCKCYVDDCFILSVMESCRLFLNYLNSKITELSLHMKLNQTKHCLFLILTLHIHMVVLCPQFTVSPPSQGYSQILKVFFFLFTKVLCFAYTTCLNELRHIQTLLNQNGYLSRFVEKCVCNFLDKTFSSPLKQSTAPKYLLSFLLKSDNN